ncbi:MAG: TolC family protein [Candidatus Omnitrophica bacterium]|nr:TolC family protein [Candidatus Omnitrophota bacterium]
MRKIVSFLTLLMIQPSWLAAQDAGATASPSALPLAEEEITNVETAPTTLSLAEVLEEARNQNPEILAAKKKWLSEKARILGLKSLPDPEFGVEFWGAHEKWYDAGQKILFPGKLHLKGKAQEHQSLRYQEVYFGKQNEILEKVKSAYYSYFLAVRQIDIFQESVSLLKRFSKVAENKYSVNRTSQSDVLKAQVEYFKSLNALVTLKQDKETAEAELNALLNRKPSITPLGKPQEPGLATLNQNYDQLIKTALERRPEIHAAEQQVSQEKALVSSSWAELLPDTNFQYSRRTFNNGLKDDNIFIARFSVPFAYPWKQGSFIKSEKLSLEEARSALASEENETRYQVKSFLVKAQTARRLIDQYKTSVIPQAETSLKVATAGYESGSLSFLDLLDSERTWLQFQMEYYQYLAQYWTYLAALERVVGEDLVPFEG